MTLVIKCVAVVIGIVGTGLLTLAQGEDPKLVEYLTDKVKEVYGEIAPSTVTLVTKIRPTISVSRGRGPLRPIDESVLRPGREGGAESQNAIVFTSLGDSATGVIIAERGDELYLDASPCDGKIASFLKPFSKTEAGTVTCSGKTIARYRIVQK